MSNKKRCILILLILFPTLSFLSVYFGLIHDKKIYTMVGSDLYFHLNRIEALANAIKSGIFIPQLDYNGINGLGYATPLFYNNLMIYPGAILRVAGLSLSESMIISQILVAYLTLVSALLSFFMIKKDMNKALIFSIFYTFSAYRLLDVITRESYGEICSFIFLPIILAGTISVFLKGKRWLLLPLGMSLMLGTHLLSAMMSAVMIFVYLIFKLPQIIKMKQWKVIKRLFISVVMTLLMSAVFLFPMLEQLTSNKFKLSETKLETSFLWPIWKYILNGFKFPNSASLNSFQASLGLFLMVGIIYVFIRLKSICRDDKEILIVGLITFIMASNLFPWQLFSQSFLANVQFPLRFLSIATLTLTWAFVSSLKKGKYLMILVPCFILFAVYSANPVGPFTSGQYTSYEDLNKMNLSTSIGRGEYLPKNMTLNTLKEEDYKVWSKDKSVEIQVDNSVNKLIVAYKNAAKETVIYIPKIWYKGYTIQNTENKKELDYKVLENGLMKVNVENSGKFLVTYTGTKIQYLSIFISALSFLVYVIYIIRYIKNKYATLL